MGWFKLGVTSSNGKWLFDRQVARSIGEWLVQSGRGWFNGGAAIQSGSGQWLMSIQSGVANQSGRTASMAERLFNLVVANG